MIYLACIIGGFVAGVCFGPVMRWLWDTSR
jgi:hypothetical protein